MFVNVFTQVAEVLDVAPMRVYEVVTYNVSASARGKILHSDLHNNTLHALQLRQHPGGHPEQTG